MFSSLVLQILSQVNNVAIGLHMHVRYLAHPGRYSSGKKTNLKVITASTLDAHQNFIYIFLKAKLEHLISFI
jgi:hypothetical protein